MPGLIKRRMVDQAHDLAQSLTTPQAKEPELTSVDTIISTGSTLLDLAISGRRRKGGGIPGGILCEIFGPSGWGKSSLMCEICASAQSKGGFAMIGDVERRLDPSFIQYMGLRVDESNLKYPHTVEDLERLIFDTPESGEGIIDVVGADSIAALISSQEMKTKKVKNEEGEEETVLVGTKVDKRGSAKAKDLHSLCRRAKTEIGKKNRLVVFTNQVQIKQDEFGTAFLPQMYKEKTVGGDAVPYYASLRLRMGPGGKDSHIVKTIKVGSKEVKQVKGIKSNVYVWKSSVDAPYRSADVYIMFDYGVDDIRANLEYIKEMSGSKNYWAVDKDLPSLEAAISNIEDGNLQQPLKEAVIDMWEEIEEKFRFDRKPKQR